MRKTDFDARKEVLGDAAAFEQVQAEARRAAVQAVRLETALRRRRLCLCVARVLLLAYSIGVTLLAAGLGTERLIVRNAARGEVAW